MPRWPRVHPLSFPRFLISLFIKLNIEDYKGNQWHWNDTLKYFSNCDIRVSLLTTKSSIGPNNYHNFKAVMSINQFCHSVMPDSLRPHELQHTRPPCPSPSPRACSNSCPLSQYAIWLSHLLSLPSPLALNLSQHQDVWQWIGSSRQVAKVLEFQHQSSWWIFRVDFL